MRSLAALGLLLLLAPSASACLDASGAELGAADGAGANAVAPFLDVIFEDRPLCRSNARDDCLDVPTADEPYVKEGIVRWWWDLENCAAGAFGVSVDSVIITFEPYARNPDWLEITMEPSEIELTWQEQWDVTDDKPNTTTGAYEAVEEWPITITITRTGDPTGADLEHLKRKNGFVEIMMRGRSSETDLFQPAYAFEVFPFEAYEVMSAAETDDDKDTPALVLPMVVLALFAVALLRRK